MLKGEKVGLSAIEEADLNILENIENLICLNKKNGFFQKLLRMTQL